jgi:nicotinamidase-related amidase
LPIRSAKICATWQAFSEPIDFARYAVTLMLAERRRQPFPATFATTAADRRFPFTYGGCDPEPGRIDRRRAALIAYDVCRRALTPSDPARRAAMRPVLDAWVQMIAAARVASVPVIYTTPVSRADGADVVMLPTDPSAETGVPPLTNAVEGTAEAGFPDEISPRPEDYVFLKRRPRAFYGTGVVELLHMLRHDTIIIGGGATNFPVAAWLDHHQDAWDRYRIHVPTT